MLCLVYYYEVSFRVSMRGRRRGWYMVFSINWGVLLAAGVREPYYLGSRP